MSLKKLPLDFDAAFIATDVSLLITTTNCPEVISSELLSIVLSSFNFLIVKWVSIQ